MLDIVPPTFKSFLWRQGRPGRRFARLTAVVLVGIGLLAAPAPPSMAAMPGRPAVAEPRQAQNGPAELDPQEIEQRLQELGPRLSEVRERQATAGLPVAGLAPSSLTPQTATLEELEALYKRQLNTLKRRDSLRQELAFRQDAPHQTPVEELSQTPPYNLSFYDGILQQYEAASRQEDELQLELRQARLGLADARHRSDTAAQALRIKREELEPAGDGVPSAGERRELEALVLEQELARAGLELLQLGQVNAELRLSLARQKMLTSRELVEWVRQHLHYDRQDLEAQLSGLADRKAALNERIRDLSAERQVVENTWIRAQRQAVPDDDQLHTARAEAFLKEREAWRDTYQRVLKQTESMVNLIAAEESLWRQRYALVKGDYTYAGLGEWQVQSRERLAALGRAIQVQQAYYAGVLAQISALQKPNAHAAKDAQVRRHDANRLQALHKAGERSAEYLTALHGARLMEGRFLAEAAALREDVGLGTRVKAAFERLQGIWHLELWVVDERAVTVKKLIVAILILLFGILLTKGFIGIMNRRILPKTRLDDNARSSLNKLIYYFVLLVIVLFALKTVNIPLTAFTFLGGALAIGAGFGAQNLINNFISGFILMLERPIRIGDMVEMEGKFGVINAIGARCTSLRTFDNIDILIPNSSFLEKSIINWTMTDQVVRSKIVVGVAYGSATREVSRHMLQAAEEHAGVLQQPRPFVLFKEFGDNALVFELYFWIPFTGLLTVPSDIRFRIDEIFREHGHVIAFPQCDVHLDSQGPIEMRIVRDQAPGPSDTAEDDPQNLPDGP